MLEKIELGNSAASQHEDGRRNKLLAAIEELAKMKTGSLTGEEPLTALEQWDSLAMLDFMLEVQKEFGVEISPESLENCKTVEDLIHVVLGSEATGVR